MYAFVHDSTCTYTITLSLSLSLSLDCVTGWAWNTSWNRAALSERQAQNINRIFWRIGQRWILEWPRVFCTIDSIIIQFCALFLPVYIHMHCKQLHPKLKIIHTLSLWSQCVYCALPNSRMTMALFCLSWLCCSYTLSHTSNTRSWLASWQTDWPCRMAGMLRNSTNS